MITIALLTELRGQLDRSKPWVFKILHTHSTHTAVRSGLIDHLAELHQAAMQEVVSSTLANTYGQLRINEEKVVLPL